MIKLFIPLYSSLFCLEEFVYFSAWKIAPEWRQVFLEKYSPEEEDFSNEKRSITWQKDQVQANFADKMTSSNGQ